MKGWLSLHQRRKPTPSQVKHLSRSHGVQLGFLLDRWPRQGYSHAYFRPVKYLEVNARFVYDVMAPPLWTATSAEVSFAGRVEISFSPLGDG